MKEKKLIGKTKYFVHRGTWENEYEWRIQEVVIKGLSVNDKGKVFANFSFSSCGYEYPISYLKDSYEEAKEFAIKRIFKEARRLIKNLK